MKVQISVSKQDQHKYDRIFKKYKMQEDKDHRIVGNTVYKPTSRSNMTKIYVWLDTKGNFSIRESKNKKATEFEKGNSVDTLDRILNSYYYK